MKAKIKKLAPRKIKNYYHFCQSLISNIFYQFPDRKLIIIGVTGTDGKTTTVNIIYHLLKKAGKKVSMISTISAVIGDESFETGFHVTSPDPWLVPKYLKQAVKAGSEYMVLEVTSHALDQFRMACIKYDVGVVTNITHEHLDYHETYEKYLKAKSKLLRKSKIAVLNADDDSYELLRKCCLKNQFVSYGLQKLTDLNALEIVYNFRNTQFTLSYNQTAFRNVIEGKKMTKKKKIDIICQSPLLGDYNVANVLAAFTTTLALGIEDGDLVRALKSFKPITGRLEEVDTQKEFRVIIDFAHTTGSFAKLLPLAQKLLIKKDARLIHVFGAAGLRDIEKRPVMGELSGRYADITILTVEDPRTEDVNEIITQIAKGCEQAQMKPKDYLKSRGRRIKKVYYSIPDRQEAINFALTKVAEEGDLVLITGKGHETTMCYGDTEFPWSDHEAVEKALLLREASSADQ